MTPEQEKLLRETHDKIGQLVTVILGVPGTTEEGLSGAVKTLHERTRKLSSCINKLNLRFWILTAFLVASGVLNSFQLVNLVKGG